MAEFPALPLWTDAYLGDTTHLTTIEHGAYLLLLMTAWRTRDCALPDDDRLLARYTRLGAGQWKRIRPTLEPFFTVRDGFWRQGRLTGERSFVQQQHERRSTAGKAGALAKSLKHNNRGPAKLKQGSSNAEAEPKPGLSTHTHIKREPKGSPKRSLPDDWQPQPFGEDTQSRLIVESWTESEFAQQTERFKAHHRGAGSKFADWQSAWSTWVLNSERFARPRSTTPPQRNFEDVVLEEAEIRERAKAATG